MKRLILKTLEVWVVIIWKWNFTRCFWETNEHAWNSWEKIRRFSTQKDIKIDKTCQNYKNIKKIQSEKIHHPERQALLPQNV